MAKKDEKDDDLIMVGDGVDDEAQKPATVTDDDADGKVKADADADADTEEEEEELAAGDRRVGGGEPEDDEEKNEARKAERKTRRQRQKDARERDQRELNFLRQRNEQVERQLGELARRQTTTEQTQIDARIAQLDSAIRSADDVYAKAVSAGEGADAAEATRIRETLKEQRDGLKSYKAQAAQQARTTDDPDPALVENVRRWHDKNKWFDFGRRNEDSAIAGAIDDMLVRDGYDPRTPEYYEELDKRIARRLPHLSKKKGNGADDDDDLDNRDERRPADDKGKKKSGGPKFRVGGRDRPLKSNEVHISRERREAMEQAGVWEDPVLRKNYLKRYAEWDREHGSNA